jgi:hypothetical protein
MNKTGTGHRHLPETGVILVMTAHTLSALMSLTATSETAEPRPRKKC